MTATTMHINKPKNLIPNDSHKSFYGKAKLIPLKNGIALKSYDTIVCSAIFGNNGVFYTRHWNDYSATTMRHINAFNAFIGIHVGGKQWWESMPINKSVVM